MKKLLLLSFFCISFSAYSQVLNGGFESWTSGAPDNWVASNAYALDLIPITKSTIAHSDSFSVKGTVIPFTMTPFNPILQAGSGGGGFTVNQNYASVIGYFQLSLLSGDRFTVNVVLYSGGAPIGIAAQAYDVSASSWTKFDIPFVYQTGGIPDNCILQFSIIGPNSGNDSHPGSYFLLDDVSLSGTATGINDHNKNSLAFSLEQNYPNPFNPSTTIRFTLPERSIASLTIFNQLGQKVDELFNTVKEAGSYVVNWNASKLSSGTYIYELKSGNFREVKKLLLMK